MGINQKSNPTIQQTGSTSWSRRRRDHQHSVLMTYLHGRPHVQWSRWATFVGRFDWIYYHDTTTLYDKRGYLNFSMVHFPFWSETFWFPRSTVYLFLSCEICLNQFMTRGQHGSFCIGDFHLMLCRGSSMCVIVILSTHIQFLTFSYVGFVFFLLCTLSCFVHIPHRSIDLIVVASIGNRLRRSDIILHNNRNCITAIRHSPFIL